MADIKATLTLDGTTYDLPVMRPTVGPDVLDIRKLYAEADVFTFDPGFTSTAACATRSNNWPKSPPISKSATCCFTVNCPPPPSWPISPQG